MKSLLDGSLRPLSLLRGGGGPAGNRDKKENLERLLTGVFGLRVGPRAEPVHREAPECSTWDQEGVASETPPTSSKSSLGKEAGLTTTLRESLRAQAFGYKCLPRN